jgi:hypothetical protein
LLWEFFVASLPQTRAVPLIVLDEDLATRPVNLANGSWMISELPDLKPYFDNESDIYDELPTEDVSYDE